MKRYLIDSFICIQKPESSPCISKNDTKRKLLEDPDALSVFNEHETHKLKRRDFQLCESSSPYRRSSVCQQTIHRVVGLVAISFCVSPVLGYEFTYPKGVVVGSTERRPPHLITEWASILPLAIYLCTFRQDYQYAGEVSLEGRLSVGLFPKLWALGSVSRLLKERELFFDLATASGDPMLVYDIQLGNQFRSSNSSAAYAIARTGLSHKHPRVTLKNIREWLLDNAPDVARKLSTQESIFNPNRIPELIQLRLSRQRKQTLHVLRFGRDEAHTWTRRHDNRLRSLTMEFIVIICLITILLVTGNLGSGALLLFAGITRALSHTVELPRPGAYLESQEPHDGCMLASAHGNASTWYLFTGDIGVVDTLLNKPMFQLPDKPPSKFLIVWFEAVQILQMAAMTFVAVQKQWDGMCLLVLVLVALGIEKSLGDTRHADGWMRRKGITCTSVTVEFAGRHDLMGTVQLMSTCGNTLWMDCMLPVSTRRNVLLWKLGIKSVAPEKLATEYNRLSDLDKEWVDTTAMQTLGGVRLVKDALYIP